MPDQRRLTLVVGVDPAATATVAATLAALGMRPAPPGWVADLHADLLAREHVEPTDARPSAWYETGKLAANGITRARLTDWLAGRFAEPRDPADPDGERVQDVVVADPGLIWLLGLWRAAALRCDAAVAQVVVLQEASEVAADVSGLATWLNLVLHAERATRDNPRAFLRYADVAADWTIPFVTLGRELTLRPVQEATANQIRQGHTVVAAGPTPATRTWADVGAPAPVRELAEATWSAVSALTDPAADTADARGRLDELRADYQNLYDDAEALTRSSVRAAVASTTDSEPAQDGPVGRGRLRRALGRDR